MCNYVYMYNSPTAMSDDNPRFFSKVSLQTLIGQTGARTSVVGRSEAGTC